jgi:hypothetical protein
MMAPALEYVATFEIAVGAPLEAGAGGRMIPVLGGRVRGPRLNGTILPGGADWQQQDESDVLRIGGRWIMETDDGARIQVETPGIRRASSHVRSQLLAGHDVDPAHYYFRVAPTFAAANDSYAWLQQALFVGMGAKQPEAVKIDVFAVG